MKMTDGLALGDGAGELAERLAHQAGLQADVRVADFAFEFLARHQGGHRVDDDHVDGVGLDEHFGDVHGLFAAARLADQQGFEVDAELLGPTGVEGVLGVDERRDAAGLLGLGHDVQGERGLAAGFGAEDLDDAAAGHALAAQGDVEREAAGGDALDAGDASPPRGMIEPSPYCFSMAATVFLSSGAPSSIESAGDFLPDFSGALRPPARLSESRLSAARSLSFLAIPFLAAGVDLAAVAAAVAATMGSPFLPDRRVIGNERAGERRPAVNCTHGLLYRCSCWGARGKMRDFWSL